MSVFISDILDTAKIHVPIFLHHQRGVQFRSSADLYEQDSEWSLTRALKQKKGPVG